MTVEIYVLLVGSVVIGVMLWKFLANTESPLDSANATNVDSKSAKAVSFLDPTKRHKR
ncbi:hypothetical protein [Leptospira santarosai]|uniref:hypothetical protein n=1 Tax=Leptospira santarosai TaxID=28183 RepID=UPI0002BD5FCA|nr:hypothetical protein [Leptospira santarosai]EMO12500.1 hypothetical protein LEP1GSC165_0018 [Leptospira santarosai str. CBC523]MDI7183634.1 hypothetical protein [Leptospira santarosai]